MILELKAIRLTPTCRFERLQRVDSITGNAFVSCWLTTTFRQQRPLTSNWPVEKSIETIVFHKLSICKYIEHTCKLMIRTKLEHSTLCFHSFPCRFKICAGLGHCSHPTDLACGRSGGPIGTAQQDFFNTIIPTKDSELNTKDTKIQKLHKENNVLKASFVATELQRWSLRLQSPPRARSRTPRTCLPMALPRAFKLCQRQHFPFQKWGWTCKFNIILYKTSTIFQHSIRI